ncbi:MAG: hypothetical protein QOE28_418 [Solirubrobacteraceae bacterium]|nr:hypothetical protein [Solirubrobacteraceae bacterium]
MRRAAAALAVVALVAATGCGGSGGGSGSGAKGSPARGGSAAPRAPSDEDRLTALLRRRAAALQAESPSRYAATSTGPQRARDRLAAADARGLPLRAVRLTATTTDVHGARATLQVRSGYAVQGIPGRFESARTLHARRTGAGWRIVSETSRRQRHPWELAPFGATRSAHFLVFAPRAIDTTGLTDALEAGYARMRDILARGRLQRRYLVVVAGDDAQARQMTSGIRGVATLAAISDTSVSEQGAAEQVARVSSQRLLVVWPAFQPLDADGRRRVVAHELTHASLAHVTSGRTPSWLVEGVALYVSGDRRVDVAAQLVTDGTLSAGARRALTLTALSTPDAIARLGGEGQDAAYAYSSSAAFYIVARYGQKRFFDLYDAFNRESLTGKPGPDLVDLALRRTLHVGLLQLERNLRRWIVTRAVVSPLSP